MKKSSEKKSRRREKVVSSKLRRQRQDGDKRPANLSKKMLKIGATAFYWSPPIIDRRAGFTLSPESLGTDQEYAYQRAEHLNLHLQDFRQQTKRPRDLDEQRGFGTLAWLIERYKRSRAWDKVSERVRPSYLYAFKYLLACETKRGQNLGALKVSKINAQIVDDTYEKLQNGPRGRRLRTANVCISIAARAWDVVQRLYPK
jgi:hypothetical protein